MRANYRLFLTVWCKSGCQICEKPKIKTVHSKKMLAISSNFLDNILYRKMHYPWPSRLWKFWFNFLGSNSPFLNFEIWRKWKILLKQLVSTTPLKPLNRIAWNVVVMKDIMCRYAFLQEMLIWSFWGAIYIPFFVRLPVTYTWNCHSLYTAFSSNVGAWGMSLLTLSFIYSFFVLMKECNAGLCG